MKYMLIMRADDEVEAAAADTPWTEIHKQMSAYNDTMISAGVLLDAAGLTPPAEGSVVEFGEDATVVTDGPYGETHEMFNGFWIIQAGSADEAVEWARRCPLGCGAKIEVRRVHDESDFEKLANGDVVLKES